MLYAFDYKYAGLTIDAVQDSETGEIWISAPIVESLLGYSSGSVRDKFSSESFKDFTRDSLGINSMEGKSIDNSTNTYYSSGAFIKLVHWEVCQGNKQAMELAFSAFVADFDRALNVANLNRKLG